MNNKKELTDRNVAAHIPAKIPYRVEGDISRGPSGCFSSDVSSTFFGSKGSRSVNSVGIKRSLQSDGYNGAGWSRVKICAVKSSGDYFGV